jgi:hypothetical protein
MIPEKFALVRYGKFPTTKSAPRGFRAAPSDRGSWAICGAPHFQQTLLPLRTIPRISDEYKHFLNRTIDDDTGLDVDHDVLSL